MGYYVNIEDADFVIPVENLDAAYQAMCDLNKRDELKTGGSWGPREDGTYGQIAKFFAWMDADYPSKCKDAGDVLDALGFVTEEAANGDLHIWGYDSKTGNEEHFLDAIAPFVKPGSFLEWRGEDGYMWREDYDGETRQIRQGRVVYDES